MSGRELPLQDLKVQIPLDVELLRAIARDTERRDPSVAVALVRIAMRVEDLFAVTKRLHDAQQPEDAPSLYVQFGGGLVDENGDSVDFLADTRPFSDSVEYAPVRSAKQALRPTPVDDAMALRFLDRFWALKDYTPSAKEIAETKAALEAAING